MKKSMVFALTLVILFATCLFIISDSSINYSSADQQETVYMANGTTTTTTTTTTQPPVTSNEVPLLPPDMT